jgi:sigma-E factor negative regulatory protein RseC
LTQEAIVSEILDGGYAIVSVRRGTACGGVCESCGGTCSYRSLLKIRARNRVSAAVGDRVTIESRSSSVLSNAAITYLLPLVLLLVGYFISAALGAPEVWCIVASMAAFAVGIAASVMIGRHRRETITFDIISIT